MYVMAFLRILCWVLIFLLRLQLDTILKRLYCRSNCCNSFVRHTTRYHFILFHYSHICVKNLRSSTFQETVSSHLTVTEGKITRLSTMEIGYICHKRFSFYCTHRALQKIDGSLWSKRQLLASDKLLSPLTPIIRGQLPSILHAFAQTLLFSPQKFKLSKMKMCWKVTLRNFLVFNI